MQNAFHPTAGHLLPLRKAAAEDRGGGRAKHGMGAREDPPRGFDPYASKTRPSQILGG